MLIRRKINKKKITKAKYIEPGHKQMNRRKRKCGERLVRSVSTPVIKEIQIEVERRYWAYKVSKCFKNR